MAQYEKSTIMNLMRQHKDPNYPGDSYNQSETFKELRNYYIQNFSGGVGLDPKLGYWANVGEAVQQAGYRIGENLADTITGYKDFFGADESAQEDRERRAMYEEYGGGAAAPGYDPEGDFFKPLGMKARHLESALASAPQTILALGGGVAGRLFTPMRAASWARGAPAATRMGRAGQAAVRTVPQATGLGAMSATVYPQFFEQALREGLDRGRAAEQALAYTFAEVLGEAAPLSKMLRLSPKSRSFARDVLGGIAAETAGEYVTELTTMAYDMARKGEDISSDEFWERMNDVWKVSLLMSGVSQVPVAGAKRIAANIMERTRGADPEFVRRLVEEEARKLGYTNITELDWKTVLTEVERASLAEGTLEGIPDQKLEKLTEGQTSPGTASVSFDPEVIIMQASAGATSQKQARDRVKQFLMHEAATHGGLFAFFKTGAGLQGIESLREYLQQFYLNNKEAVDAWAAEDRRGTLYKGDPLEVIIEEYIAIQLAEGVKTGPIRALLSKIKLFLKKQFGAGYDFSEAEVIDLLRNVHSEMLAGRLSPEVQQEQVVEAPVAPVMESRQDIQDPSRRKFMKQVGGAAAGIAADPRMILEPATPEAPVTPETPTFGGFTPQYPGSVYEFAIQTDPSAGMLNVDDPGDTMLDVHITHNPNTNEVTVYEGDEVVDQFEVDDMHADAQVLAYVRDRYGRENIDKVFPVRREEMERDPETGEGAADYWGDADERYEQTARDVVAGRDIEQQEQVVSDRGPAYDILQEPETPRAPEVEAPRQEVPPALEEPITEPVEEPAPEPTEEVSEPVDETEIIEDILVIYDSVEEMREAAEDGSLDERIRMFEDRTGIPRDDLWDTVNKRMDSLEDVPVRESRVRLPKGQTVMRDINEGAKKARTAINALDISEDAKEERRSLLKRLQKIMGAPARKRGINAGDQDTFLEQVRNILKGALDTVIDFITPFEEKLSPPKEKVRKAEARRAQRAKRIGKTDAEILKYRPKGAKHPMEGKMTYPFALEEIDRQEKDGEITEEEAEIRRLAVNNVRRIYKGKAGNTVKRIITEATYGIGNYEELVPWSEVYTAEQTEEMGERAEVAQAEARRTRYEETDLTNKEKQDLLRKPPTEEEKAWVASDAMPSIKGSRNRLLFLRQPAEMSDAERREFEAWKKDRKGFRQEEYKAERKEKLDEQVERLEREGKIVIERLPPQDLEKMQEEHRKIGQKDPAVFDTLALTEGQDAAEAFRSAGIDYDLSGEMIPEYEGERTEDGKVVDNTKLESRQRVASKSKGTVGELVDVDLEVGGKKFDTGVRYQKGRQAPIVQYTTAEDIEDAPLTDKQRQAIRRNQSTKEGNKHYDVMKQLHRMLSNALSLSKEQKPEREHLFNTTPVERETGEKTDAADIAPNAAWNLTSIPNFLHEIKSKFEGGKDGERFQSAAPYLDISNMVDNPNIKNYGISKEDAEKIREFRSKFKESLKNSNKDLSPFQRYVDAYASALGIPTKNVEHIELSTEQTKVLENLLKTMGKVEQPSRDEAPAESLRRESEIMGEGATKGAAYFSRFDARSFKDKDKAYSEHFNDSFWYRLTSFLWGKPVQAIRDFNKNKRWGTKRGTISAADKIADLFQRHISSTMRAEGLEEGNDYVQDVSLKTGEFYSRLSKIFSKVTDNLGVIVENPNQQIIDFLAGKTVKFSHKAIREAAHEIQALMQDIYKYAKDETTVSGSRRRGGPLDLRGAGDTLLPRVWNIEYLATREGKGKFLRILSAAFSPPGSTTPIFEDADITVDDLYDVVINSGGFVQGEWTNLRADQTRSEADIAKDIKIQEYLDTLETENLLEEGLVLDDLQALIPRFIQKAVERTEYAKRFGINDELLRDMISEGIEQIRAHNKDVLRLKKGAEMPWIDEKKFAKAAWDMARIARNKYGYDMANMPTRKWLQRLTNAATVMKLPLVALASMPEFFTPMLRGDVSPHHWFMDLMAATAWAGYKSANGISKLLFNKHIPAMMKYSDQLGDSGILRDIQLLREMGIADIQAMGDLVSTRYANPNFARGGLRAGATGTLAGKIPKHVRGVFNMQTFMQATMLTTMTEMQQLMALRNFQRHAGKRIKFVQANKGKKLTGRKAVIYKQYKQDLLDYGINEDIDLSTPAGEAAFNAGSLRFIDQVITRPNDATTAKAFKNPLIAPLVLFKRFITTFGNTLLTAVGNDFAHKVDNKERAKQVGKVATTAMAMYGAVMFAEIVRGALRGDLDEDDFKFIPGDFQQFMRRLDRTGLLSAPGTAFVNLAFPYKRGWWDSTEARITSEVLGPLGGDLTTLGDTLIDPKKDGMKRLVGQLVPTTKPLLGTNKKKKKSKKRTGYSYLYGN